MTIFLPTLAISLGFLSVLNFLLVAWIPRLGIDVLYAMPRLKWWAGLLSLACAWVAWNLEPGSRTASVIGVCLLLAVLARVFTLARLIPAVRAPQHVPADQASLGENAPVLGFELPEKGESCAYPLEVLAPHHLVNDRVGGEPILAAWCHACSSGRIYHAAVNGQELVFEVAGLWRRNMIMRDVQTGSVWQHASGEALAGPLKGERLEALASEQAAWGAWRGEHPQTLLAQGPPRWNGRLPRIALMVALARLNPAFLDSGLARSDQRLAQDALVAGVVLDGNPIKGAGAAYAYALDALRKKGTIREELGDRQIVVSYEAPADRVRAFLALPDGSQQPLVVWREAWAGWYEFHPGTSLIKL